MGYRGKERERARARELRAESWTLMEIATELGVSKSSASLWTRDVDFEPRPRNRGHSSHRPHPMQIKKQADLDRAREAAEEWVGSLSHRELTMFALGLYAGEGGKTQTAVVFANTNPAYVSLFLTWMRQEFEIEEDRLRLKLYLHEGLDLAAAETFWGSLCRIPRTQFVKPYRAVADATRRTTKHVLGCATIRYSCSRTFRELMAKIDAVTSGYNDPG